VTILPEKSYFRERKRTLCQTHLVILYVEFMVRVGAKLRKS